MSTKIYVKYVKKNNREFHTTKLNLPTGNLDAENAESVAAILSRASMRYGQTIIMVTHDRQMADYADRILSMENIVACMK